MTEGKKNGELLLNGYGALVTSDEKVLKLEIASSCITVVNTLSIT